jgi:hypothetical protein
MERQRGQTLPLSLGGVIAIIVFGFFAVNYANTLRWQVRAQNAADSAAQAILSLQTQQFNEMTATLYAAAVEEYRIRHLLNGMVLASHYQGGCAYGTDPIHPNPAILAGTPAGCDYIETALEGDYDAAVGRYTGDVLLLHQVTARMNFNNFSIDALALLTKIGTCSAVTPSFSGDCAFKYGPPIMKPRTDTETVDMDANAVLKPSPNNQTALSSTTNPPLNVNLFAPVEVEVYACASVPSIIPSFFGWQFPTFTAVARGAATPAMVEEDWLQPGTITNPFTPGIAYQPIERYLVGNATVADSTGYNWYDLNFHGNGVVAANGHMSSTLTVDEFSVYVGWWNSIPIHAFGGTKALGAMGCTT